MRLACSARRPDRSRPPVPVAWPYMHEGAWTLGDCPPDAQAGLVRELGISEPTAAVLVRRGYSDPAAARRFLDGEQPPHDPFLLGDMEAACAQIRAAVEEGRRICVHGDYDVDGIAATTLAVLLLRELGAEVAWHLPSRFDEGYGVRSETLARLADEGCGLVLTVDCGITAVAEVAEARERGLDVVVTDHHRPGETLPDCPIVATRPSAYPFPELCGTGVVYKLGQALFGVDSEIPRRHLDLVALATIADVVPLVDENRSLAIAGLRALARTAKPGLRALMQGAGVDPATVDAGAVGFRLAPRRALPPPCRADRRYRRRLERIRSVDPRVRPARRARLVCRPARALGRASRRCRPFDRGAERRRVRRGFRRAGRRRARGGGPRPGGVDRRRRGAGSGPLPRSLR